MTRVFLAIRAGLGYLGKPYVYGAKPSLDHVEFSMTDCSGFIRRIVWDAGIRSLRLASDGMLHPIAEFTGSVRQWEMCRSITVDKARQNIGCFLFIAPKGAPGQPGFKAGHVALSLGHDFTLESRGGEGVTIVKPVENRKRGWTRAGKLTELFEAI